VTSSIDTVANTAVGSSLSLRQALEAHQGSTNCSTINFASSLPAIIFITSADLPTLTNASSLTITGPGAGALTVNLSGKSGIKLQSDSAGQTLSISGLTFTGGYSNRSGGAVYAKDANTEISDVTFTSNSSYGGAVSVKNGALNITNSRFTSNYSIYAGGAVYVKDGALNITGSTFTGNSSGNSNNGGAVHVEGNDDVNVSSSTFSGNTASAYGGAISALGALTLNSGTFTGNSARAGGGVVAGSVTATSTTFSQNEATYLAGAIAAERTVALTNSTLTGNTAVSGAGIYSGGTVTANFATFSGNISSSTFPSLSPSMVISLGAYTVSNSIFDEAGVALTSPETGSSATFSFFNSRSALVNNTGAGLIFADTAGVAPLNLALVLASNGGPTMTLLPGAGSPVIGAADRNSTITLDQRGFARTNPSTMGAVSVASTPVSTPAPAPAPDPDPVPTATQTPTVTLIPTPTPTASLVPAVVPVVVPVVTRPVVGAPIVLANGSLVVLPAAQRANAQVIAASEPASVTMANAPQLSVPAGSPVAPVVSGLPANTSVVVSIRVISGSRPQSVLSLLRAKSSFVTIGTTRSNAAGRVKVPAFKATRPGVYTIQLSTPAGKAYYLNVKVTAKKNAK
jgi:hypothetical protein